MAKIPRKTTVNGNANAVAMCLTLDRDAYNLVRQYAPSSKAYGHFLSRLIYEHAARVEERAKGMHAPQLQPMGGESLCPSPVTPTAPRP